MIDSATLAKIAIKNIGKRKKRAALTMLGIFIGIAAVVALVSLGQGLQETINAQFEKVGADKIIIQAKEIGFGSKDLSGKLRKHELQLVQKVHGVADATGMIFHASTVQYNKMQRVLNIMSVPETQKEVELSYAVHTMEAEEGRLLTHKDKNKAVLGYNIAKKKQFEKDIIVGDKISVGDNTVEVVGVLKRLGDPQMDASVVLPEANVREIINDPDGYTMITAQSAKNENPDDVADRIEKEIRRDRHQKEGKEDFNVQTSTELIASFNTVLNIIQAVFVGIAAISLIVGGIGIMNTMYTAVLERTREIGVMKAIGAQNSDVLGLFLIESGLLGLSGGIIGAIIGAMISKTVEIFANATYGAGTIYSAFPAYLIIGALLFSFVVGAISGLLPARRASKLKPVEALRYE